MKLLGVVLGCHKFQYLWHSSFAPVVQWIGHILAEDVMWVRFLPGAPIKMLASAGFFIGFVSAGIEADPSARSEGAMAAGSEHLIRVAR